MGRKGWIRKHFFLVLEIESRAVCIAGIHSIFSAESFITDALDLFTIELYRNITY